MNASPIYYANAYPNPKTPLHKNKKNKKVQNPLKSKKPHRNRVKKNQTHQNRWKAMIPLHILAGNRKTCQFKPHRKATISDLCRKATDLKPSPEIHRCQTLQISTLLKERERRECYSTSLVMARYCSKLKEKPARKERRLLGVDLGVFHSSKRRKATLDKAAGDAPREEN